MPSPSPQTNRDRWAAFTWHSCELGIVIALVINAPSPWLVVLLFLSLLGWGWSLGHLPGWQAPK